MLNTALSRWSAAVLVAAAALLVSPAALADPAQSLTIVNPVSLDLKTRGNEVRTTVFVRNDGAAAVKDVDFLALPAGKVKVSPTSGKTVKVKGFSVKKVRLKLTPTERGATFKGLLVVTGRDAAPGTVPLRLAPKQSPPGRLYVVIFVTAGGALLFVAFRFLIFWIATGKDLGCKLSTRLGPVNWDFSKSWGSNLTVVGALLGTILSAGVLPDETAVTKATYAGLNLLFGILILIAPLAYAAMRREKRVHRASTVQEPQYQGTVFWFLVSATLTLWAVVGELITVGLLFREIRTGESLPRAAVITMTAAVGFAGALLLLYTWGAIGAILKDQCDKGKHKRRKRQQLQMTLMPMLDRRDAGLEALQLADMSAGERELLAAEPLRTRRPSPELEKLLMLDDDEVEPELPSWSLL